MWRDIRRVQSGVKPPHSKSGRYPGHLLCKEKIPSTGAGRRGKPGGGARLPTIIETAADEMNRRVAIFVARRVARD
jgi:hypothetical protein